MAEIFNKYDNMILNTKTVLEIPELNIYNKAREERIMHIWIVPIMNINDEVEYLLGIIEDITDWKHAANERAVLEEQLRQQQRLESIGQLAAGVAHDFNNLLTGIKGFTQFAYDSVPTDSSIRSDLGEVLSLAKRAAELTRQLLAFSRRQTLQPVVIDINDLIGNLIKMLGRLIGEKIDLKFIPSTVNNTVKADPGQIEQVLVNLTINARDAMPDGGKLTIETSEIYIDKEYASSHTGTKPGPYVTITITDTGYGMDETVVKHLFEPFFTTKGIGKGTGLGLATVYGIIKQHGGNIWAYSEKNAGTTFKIYLPQVDDEIIAAVEVHHNTVEKGTETILIVEDEATVRDIAKRILETQGYTVMTAALPSEALSILDEYGDKIALMLTDIVMPEQNGTQLYESVREKYPHLRVLYMSGYPEKNSPHNNIFNQKIPFIQKPFKYDSLCIKVREVLND
jgi:two-component system cell cycle sensor histidine kinase/response regulator CckA